MAGEGQMLRAAREEKQWSLTYTEEVTKIRVRYIQALEAEEYEILPGATYAKGYLRTYARHLGLNPDEIVALYNASYNVSLASEAETSETLKRSKTPKSFKLSKLLPKMPAVNLRRIWSKPLKVGVVAVVVIGLVVGFTFFTKSHEKIANNSFPSTSKTETSKPATPSASTSDVSVPKDSSSNVVAATQDGLTAELVFTQPCWVAVQVDGKTSFQGTFTSGTSKEVKANQKIELVSVGNAAGLSVTLNGKALPPLGKSGQVLHNVMLTSDTLKSL